MESRQISGTRLISSSIGLGCLGFAGAYGSADRAQSVLVIRLALDLRVTFLAVADFYGGGAVEQIVGDAIADRRDDALIATQGGLHFTDSGRPTRIDGSPKYLKQACDASLKRLKVDHVDLYTLSRPDPRVPIEESVGGIAALVRAGKVRHVGLRGVSAATLRRAHAEYPITAIEGEYSLWERQVETDLLPMARQLGIGFVACSPLGRGFLTGRVTSVHHLAANDARIDDPRFKPESLARNRSMLSRAEEIAGHHDLGVGRLALAWLLAQGKDIVPVPAARQLTHLEMNASAVRVRLTANECKELAAVFPVGSVAGADEWRARRDAALA